MAGAVDTPIPRLFAFDRQWRRATDQRRSAQTMPPNELPLLSIL